ncbi:MAG: MFS transporter [Chloroflexota bacterium]|nr:MFS transporter [Chloroflexota bacterium]
MLLATVLGSSIVALDATVVNVALPSIGRDLGAGVDGLQWIVNGYMLTLAALILLGGSLGDRFGRRRVFLIGVIWFAIASVLCGLAPSLPLLVVARALQGIGGALLTPGSLAIIQASFASNDRGPAIGAWSGLGGIATAIGPFMGGWLVESASWRLIFLLNVPLALVVVLVSARHVAETSDPNAKHGIDVLGAVLATLALAGVTFALIQAPAAGGLSTPIVLSALVGTGCVAGFVLAEAHQRQPMLPLDLFTSRQFLGANLVTLAVYAALGAVMFLLMLELQQGLGYSPLQAGAAGVPVTIIMLVLSARAGRLAQRIGPRLPMTLGPLGAGAGMLLMARVGPGADYLTVVLPALVAFGLGLALTVAPLTATVLAATSTSRAGIASAVNNAVARVGSLLAVAGLPRLAGLTGPAATDPLLFSAGFQTAMVLCAGLAVGGAAIAWLMIRDDLPLEERYVHDHHCALDGPPLRGADRQVVIAPNLP